jgi:very-short-patch-repair endonuclease
VLVSDAHGTIDAKGLTSVHFIEDWALVVEADSRRWHARQQDFNADRARDNALAATGIQVLRFTYDMLRNDPDGCVRTIVEVGTHR